MILLAVKLFKIASMLLTNMIKRPTKLGDMIPGKNTPPIFCCENEVCV
jgi:hypothetical protein